MKSVGGQYSLLNKFFFHEQNIKITKNIDFPEYELRLDENNF
jgi:hypothetical protein